MNITEVKSSNWQMSLSGVGLINEGIDDINQCILTILGTIKGSDPLRPEFGTNVYQWLDKPVNQAIPNIIKEITSSIEIWETRIELTSIKYSVEDSFLKFFIYWKPVNSELIQTVAFILNR